MPLRILVVDDHPVVRRGIRALIESRAGWIVSAEAATGREAVALARKLQPDIVVLDLSLPELNGLDAARQIARESPRSEVLVLTMHHSEELARDVLRAGARGYVLKSDADRHLVDAIASLERHEPFLTTTVTESVLHDYVRTADNRPAGGTTTPRQREIIQLFAEGRTTKEIASDLQLSTKTVETHRANIMRKLGVRTIADLVRYAIRNNIVHP
jgi:DNA-binding NarL/FixJ family response regulator